MNNLVLNMSLIRRITDVKKTSLIFLIYLILTNISILFDVPVFKQVLGFSLLTLTPGIIIVLVLKLNKLNFSEKFVLTIGISISFSMLLGIFINWLFLALKFNNPLSTLNLLMSFNIILTALILLNYLYNNELNFSKPKINLKPLEKGLLTVLAFFPILGIYGIHLMNKYNNNILLLLLFFIIAIYIVVLTFKHNKIPERMYTVSIYLIGLSIILLYALRCYHLTGTDVHHTFWIFKKILSLSHWEIIEYNPVNACLSVTLLPVMFQSLMKVNTEYLFKILYPLLFSVTPLIIYFISKRYLANPYAFISSVYFIFLPNFLKTAWMARTNIAILFFAFSVYVLFNSQIGPVAKKILFITFIFSIVISHYTSTYISLLIFLFVLIGLTLSNRKGDWKLKYSTVILFSVLIFFWYSQVTGTSFHKGVIFVKQTLQSLASFLVLEARSESVQTLSGQGLLDKELPYKIHFIFTWFTFAFIGLGVINTVISRLRGHLYNLREQFEPEYFWMILGCFTLLMVMLAIPHMAKGYSLQRTFLLVAVILSPLFVIGGYTLSKYLNLNSNIVILLVLLPYFFCTSGAVYQLFDVPHHFILTSEGDRYDRYFIHDEESQAAKWLANYKLNELDIFTDEYGNTRLLSQGLISRNLIKELDSNKNVDNNYVYLRYYNVVHKKLIFRENSSTPFYTEDIGQHHKFFYERKKIYTNGASDVVKRHY